MHHLPNLGASGYDIWGNSTHFNFLIQTKARAHSTIQHMFGTSYLIHFSSLFIYMLAYQPKGCLQSKHKFQNKKRKENKKREELKLSLWCEKKKKMCIFIFYTSNISSWCKFSRMTVFTSSNIVFTSRANIEHRRISEILNRNLTCYEGNPFMLCSEDTAWKETLHHHLKLQSAWFNSLYKPAYI
jgi:hypothetical protein